MGKATRRRVGLLAVAVMVPLLSLVVPGPAAHADGTETLGPPSIAIAPGSGVVTAGTGLKTQPGTVELSVPDGAVVRQVLLYWEGAHYRDDAPDDSIVVDGTTVAGTLIGGPTFFFPDFDINPPDNVFTSAFRADITDLGLVSDGPNSLTLSGLSFSFRNDGASIVVVYDDSSGVASISVVDGLDNAFDGFPEPRRSTVPQSLAVAPAPFDRTAALTLMVASVTDDGRTSAVEVTSGGVTTVMTNVLASNEGPEWDNLTLPVTVPAGATDVTVRIVSNGDLPASVVWVGAVLVAGNCPPPSTAPAVTRGSAFAIDARVPPLNITELGKVATVAPGTPMDQATVALRANVPGLLTADVAPTQSHSSLTPVPASTATSAVTNVSLLGGQVQASELRAVSQSVAAPSGSSFSSSGSVISGLRIGGMMVNAAPNTTFDLRVLGLKVAEVHVYEEVGTSTFASGVSSASHSVTMLRVKLLRNFLGLAKGAEIRLAQASTDTSGPGRTPCPGQRSVSGEAFTAYADGNLVGTNLVEVQVGGASLPPTGGSASDGVAIALGNVATSGTAANTTSGSLDPNPNATARSRVQGARLLNGLVTADVLDVSSTSTADGSQAGTVFGFTAANLRVGGATVAADAAPNTVISLDLPGGGLLRVIVNERIGAGNGLTDSEGTINAIHAFVFGPAGLLQGEVIVASAHSDAHT